MRVAQRVVGNRVIPWKGGVPVIVQTTVGDLELQPPEEAHEAYHVMNKVCRYCSGVVDAAIYTEPDVNGFDLLMWCSDCHRQLTEEELVDGEWP